MRINHSSDFVDYDSIYDYYDIHDKLINNGTIISKNTNIEYLQCFKICRCRSGCGYLYEFLSDIMCEFSLLRLINREIYDTLESKKYRI